MRGGDAVKFTVSRETWIRGGDDITRLLRPRDGKMCCLGFVCEQLGVPRDELRDRGAPADVGTMSLRIVEGVLTRRSDLGTLYNNDLTESAIGINDDEKIDDDERERRLTALFAEHGHELEFVP
jgi:hypothetical protein